jgi:tetratricopeptide (TPR) repeat protein
MRPVGDSQPPFSALGAGIAVGALAALTYAGTLGHGFVWDDPISVRQWLPALPTVWSAFFPPENIPQFPPDYYRPLQLLSYRVDRFIGGGQAWSFHLTVVLLHVLATVLVFRTGLRLLGRAPLASWAALWAAALFAVHPIHSESVAWMAARPDVMVTCAGLGALLAYWSEGSSMWRRSAMAAAFVFFGLLCKENAAALLVLVPASLSVFDPPRSRAARVALPPFAVAALAYAVLRSAGLRDSSLGPLLAENPLPVYAGALGTYLRLLVIPYPQNAYIADLPAGTTTFAMHVLALLAFAAVSWRAWQRRDRAVLYALAWLGLTLAPSLVIIARSSSAPIAERYLYLPSVGLCWMFGVAIARLCQDRRLRLAVQVAAALLILLAGARTLQRNQVWHDNYTLWSDTAGRNPVDGLPWRSLAAATLERGDAAEAERLFKKAREMRNDTRGLYIIHNNLGTIAYNRNDDVAAEEYYRKALQFDPAPACFYNLGLLVLKRALNPQITLDPETRAAQSREARKFLEQALAASPYDAEIHVGLAQAAQTHGDKRTARRHFERAIELGLPTATEAAVRRLMEQL